MTLPLPPDPEGENDNRAEWAGAALETFTARTRCEQEDDETRLSDLLADFMHWCDRHDVILWQNPYPGDVNGDAHVQSVHEAVAVLSRTERGRKVLQRLRTVLEVSQALDSEGTQALITLVKLGHGLLNGTVRRSVSEAALENVEAPVVRPTTKSFRIIHKSSNTNSFGLRGFIVVARDGEAWEIARSAHNGSPEWKHGEDIQVPCIYPDTPTGIQNVPHLQWSSLSVEIPRRIHPDCGGKELKLLYPN